MSPQRGTNPETEDLEITESVDPSNIPSETKKTTSDSRSRRTKRNSFGVRNKELVIILIIALLLGVAVTLFTAYLGLR